MDQKIWGETYLVFQNDTVDVHLLKVKKGGVCSWHYHEYKYNHFCLISGKFAVRINGVGECSKSSWMRMILDKPGMFFVVGPGKDNAHEFQGLEDSTVLEVCYTKPLDPEDIKRLRPGYIDIVDSDGYGAVRGY